MLSVYMMNLLVKAHVEPLYEAAKMYRLADIAQRESADPPVEAVAITERERDLWTHWHETPRRPHLHLTLRHAHR
ncbi:MAG: hypothetical protein L6Q98_18900 [Anaerolineae bacterium]|nr:hypothetical protein [Anaerolineae bacterium]NUQ05430.1 hypothetical protein [Anaerolineae bacterium]